MVEDYAAFIGRSTEARDDVVAAPVRRLAATLGHDGAHWPDDALPLLGHWLYTLPETPRSDLAEDGHARRGGFLPPFPGARRMWAGGRFRFLAPIAFGTVLTRRTTIRAIDVKASGMTFVTLLHQVAADGVAAVEEEQDLVYLAAAPAGSPKPTEVPATESEQPFTADETLLFRFSALTFNTHRIHYDHDYCRQVEHYPGLVVHGPLQAMALLDHAVRAGATPERYAFRARAPLYAGTAAMLARAGDALWVRDAAGVVTMTASIA